MARLRRVLIANRGEIAVRILRTCREMGIDAVALATPDEPASLPAVLADAVAEVPSYVDADGIVAAATAVGADAVHPGYGFLSEDPGFAELVLGSGLRWIGPPPEAMRRLGDKIGARSIAAAAGVPVVPGYAGSDASDVTLEEAAASLGAPLLVKAAAGGGGRGMRRVDDLSRLREAIADARGEASAAFGDERVFLERRLDAVRHVEVQVLIDGTGNAVHLGERDCSLQRRHQKVVEEAPAPTVGASLRRALGEAAVGISKEAGYRGAGTAEFLLGDTGAWWFLEMNARLQVEHPVTEAVVGLDIVRAQLDIASDEPLRVRQDEVRVAGHAVEARIYAEDPAAGFVPATGRVELLDLPRWPGVRIDTALRAGDVIGVHYDPLLAKVVAVAEDRAASLGRLRAALREIRIVGVKTNLGFLIDALGSPDVAAARADTEWVESTWAPRVPALPAWVRPGGDPADPWFAFGASPPVPGVTIAGAHAQYEGWAYELEDDLAPVELAPAGGSLRAPMPGTIQRVDVRSGDVVTAGQALAMLEGMKVHVAIPAPSSGTVRAVHVRPGDVVAAGTTLIEVDAS
jgi:acetyl/propionyl-CoA carboxylase alpha subunit